MDRPSTLPTGQPAGQPNGASALTTELHPTPSRESVAAAVRKAELLRSTRPPASIASSASQPPSTTSSPFASREPSPVRRPSRSVKTAPPITPLTPNMRRKNSQSQSQQTQPQQQQQQQQQPPLPLQADPSTPRARSSIPARTTPSLSAVPSLAPAPSDASTSTPAPHKTEQSPLASPRWPVLTRLRSPPPVLRPESSTASAAPDCTPTPSDSEAEDAHLTAGMRTPSRSVAGLVPALETVQEASPLGTPRALDAALEKLETASIDSSVLSIGSAVIAPEVVQVSPSKTIRARHLVDHSQAESGSESAGGVGSVSGVSSVGSTRIGRRGTLTSAPPLTPRHTSSSTVRGSSTKGKTGEAQATMTVETETVTSIPNVAVGPAAVQGSNGSLRTRPSTETIRPKKERRKTSRKQPAGAVTKAEIFEAKIANAVDEANTSDSEETFVYDSNPADSRERPHRFHHSRTPSATSMATNDRGGMRSIHSVLEGPPATVTVKKSMKFVNTFGNSSGNDSGLGDDEAKGTAGRGTVTGSARGTVRLHHHVGGSHIGRWGLSGPKNGHQSLFDNETLFPVRKAGGNNPPAMSSNGNMTSVSNASMPNMPSMISTTPNGNGNSLGGRTAPASPRASNLGTVRTKRGLSGTGAMLAHGYDLDETTSGRGGDERTPLLSPSMRSGRNGRATRRHHVSLRSLEQQQYRPGPSFLNRFASCLVLTVMLMLVISGAIGFMFATSQPLEDIALVKISSVIASEQELMFDLTVRAHNPNVVIVTVDAADMEVFAKSPHAGDWYWGGGDMAAAGTDVSVEDNVPRDQPDTSPNFLLGKFTNFDNPLSFEGSFFHHGLSTSRSGVRIRHPGNGTAGGTWRWERILDDEFDLIVKGVLRYSLPLSQRVRSALIEGRTTVKPNAAEDPVHPNGTAWGGV